MRAIKHNEYARNSLELNLTKEFFNMRGYCHELFIRNLGRFESTVSVYSCCRNAVNQYVDYTVE